MFFADNHETRVSNTAVQSLSKTCCPITRKPTMTLRLVGSATLVLYYNDTELRDVDHDRFSFD